MNMPLDNVLDIIAFLDLKSWLSLRQTCKWFTNINISRLIIKTDRGGYIEYRLFGELHQNDGPAVIQKDGTRWWYQYGKIHNNNGPAIINAHGTQFWLHEGELFRVH